MDDNVYKRFTLDEEGMQEVIPGQLWMKHLHAKNVTLVLYRVVCGPDLPALPVVPHQHGEEVVIMLRGSAWIHIGGVEHGVEEGEVFVIPPGALHQTGRPVQGDHFFLSVTAPPRTDLGDDDPESTVSIPTYLDMGR